MRAWLKRRRPLLPSTASPRCTADFAPVDSSNCAGQDHVVRALQGAVKNQRVSHAYLFSGPRGTGKTTTARILAKALNCENPLDGDACNVCASCVAITKGTSLDVTELDAASNNGVDDIRDITAGRLARNARKLEGLHLRRGPPTLQGRVGRALEDAGGAAAARRLRARHDRPAQGDAHDSLAHPAPGVPTLQRRDVELAVARSRRRRRV